ncbi:MAG: adenylate kinase [Bacteroidales bacterium]|nr:adenylate kinase [Bacteroidales bacterium]
MKYYVLFGPPGAGKGTHAVAIADKYHLKHISTGELLRAEIAAGTQLGKQAKALIDAGSLVPDSVVEGMIASAFDTIKGYDGFLLDGFPRTIAQAQALDRILQERGETLEAVISIMIPDEVIYERIARRAQQEGRADDTSKEVIAHRIETYHTQTEPLIGFYRNAGKYHEVAGHPGTIEENRNRVLAMLEAL